MVARVEETRAKEEVRLQTTSTPPPPRTERYEKQEKDEKHEKHEKQEKQEKEVSEKSEKHEKKGLGIWGSVLAGILLVVFGIIILLAEWYGVPSWLWWPIFLIMAGIAVVIYVIVATVAMRRSPPPT